MRGKRILEQCPWIDERYMKPIVYCLRKLGLSIAKSTGGSSVASRGKAEQITTDGGKCIKCTGVMVIMRDLTTPYFLVY